MRLVYVDEAGIGDHKQEPIAVAAAVMVEADRQWPAIVERLNAIAEKHIHMEDRDGFIFHASDLFHEGKKINREKYSPKARLAILAELCLVLIDFSIPIYIAPGLKTVTEDDGSDRKISGNAAATAAIMLATSVADSYIRIHYPGERSVIVIEDNSQNRRSLKEFHNRFAKAKVTDGRKGFETLIDTVHFAAKSEAPLLQLADICACVMKRRMMGAKGHETFSDPLMHLVFEPDGFLRDHRLLAVARAILKKELIARKKAATSRP
jgi:hypothetical protein